MSELLQTTYTVRVHGNLDGVAYDDTVKAVFNHCNGIADDFWIGPTMFTVLDDEEYILFTLFDGGAEVGDCERLQVATDISDYTDYGTVWWEVLDVTEINLEA